MAILKIFKPHQLPNGKSDRAKTWWEALGRHGDSELLKPFCYDIHDGSHLEGLQLLPHLSFAPGQLMPWSIDHGPSLIRMSISKFSQF